MENVLKLLDKFGGKHPPHEVLTDCFEMWAIAISNRFDHSQAKGREKRYLEIVGKYKKDELDLIVDMFAEVYSVLPRMIDNGFSDYLGELYMSSNTSNSKSGQFFTPYSVSRACAELAINGKDLDKDVITMDEPSCGSGGMVLAAADVLWNKYKFNYASRLLVHANDIDKRCVHMCYIQLSLAGIPAVIEQRDALTQELVGDVWYTPAYLMQYLKFKKYF